MSTIYLWSRPRHGTSTGLEHRPRRIGQVRSGRGVEPGRRLRLASVMPRPRLRPAAAPVPGWLRGLAPGRPAARRLASLYAGIVLFGVSVALMIAARLGLDPWDVFHQG